MRKNTAIILACLLTGASAPWAWGTGITIGNNSFEGVSASVSAPTSLGVTIAGSKTNSFGLWTGIVGSTVIGLSPSSITAGTAVSLGGPTPLDGTSEVRISMGAGVGQYVILSQSLSAIYAANSHYTLSFDLDAGVNVSLFTHAYFELLAGTTPVASIGGTNLLSLLNSTPGFQTISLDYYTGASAPSGNIGIQFEADSVLALGADIYADNALISVTTVPEPTAGLLLGGGFGFLLLVTRGRKDAGRVKRKKD